MTRRTLRGVMLDAILAPDATLAVVALCGVLAASTPALAQTSRSTSTKSARSAASAKRAAQKTQTTPARSATPSESMAAAGELLVAPSGSVVLRDEPEGHALATLGAGTSMTAVAHDRGWVRVHVDGWVREDSVQVSNGSTTGSLSAADVRVDPQGAKGKTVRWDVQVLALETADLLHHDLKPDEPYLLARGPGSDNMLMYVAVPPSLLASAKTLAAAAPVNATLVAIVRVGRGEPVGVPVLDAQSIARR